MVNIMNNKTLMTKIVLTVSFFLILVTKFSNLAFGSNNFKTLNVGVDSSLPPFQFEDNDKIVGLNIDILDSIAAKNNIKIHYIPINKDSEMESLLDGKVDVILGVRYNASLTEQVSYTENIVQSVVCMIAKSSSQKNIQNHLNTHYFIASVEKDSVELNFLNNLRRVNFNVAFNQEDAFQLLLMDRADFFLGVKDTAEYLLNKDNLMSEYTVIDSYITPVEYLIAVKSANNNLLNMLNNGISHLKLSGEYETLYNKWIKTEEANIRMRLKKIMQIGSISAVVAFIIFSIGIIWNIQLKNQVKIKTDELSKTNRDLERQITETRNNIELTNLIGQSSPRGIATFNIDGTITMFNDSALKMSSLHKSPIGQSIYDIEPMNLMLKDTAHMVLKEKKGYTCEEFNYKNKDINLIYRYVIYPLKDFQDKIRGVIITIEDITEERKLMGQIAERDKNRALGQIISGISHEIRNPLTSIKTFIELIPKKIDNEKFREEISILVPEEIRRVDNLIESLIDYSKPKVLNKTNFNLEEIVISCISLLEPIINKNSINISTLMDSNLPVYCDKDQIKQCIINFILNSIDAIIEKRIITDNTDYQGELIIKGYTKDNKLILKIMDNGIGMDGVELDKSHEVFYTTKGKGTGLGFPLSIEMLNKNDCKVSVESKKYEFTNIIIQFPR